MDNINVTMPFGTIGIYHLYDKNLPKINSDNYRLFFVIAGTARLRLKNTGEKYFIKKSDIISVSPGTDFVLSHKDEIEMCCLSFDEKYLALQLGEISSGKGFRDLFSENENGIKSFRRSLADSNRAYYLVKDIFEEAEKQQTGFKMIINARFAELIIIFSRSPSCSAELCSKPASQAVFEAAEFMENNFTLDITVDRLASYVNLSSRHFARVFRDVYGVSPMKYLETLRLQRAAAMLVNTDKTVTEISFDCGYNDSNYFSKQFKRYFSGTPVKYRRFMRETGKTAEESAERSASVKKKV